MNKYIIKPNWKLQKQREWQQIEITKRNGEVPLDFLAKER